MSTTVDWLKRLAYRVHPRLSGDFRRVMSLEGYLSLDEARLLFELASRVNHGCIVEVGSYRGKSTVALALGARRGHEAPVYAIDPHEHYVGISGKQFGPADRKAFFRSLLKANCVELVRLVNLSSEIICGAWNQPVALLWLDGDHRYQAVKRDFECWAPWLTRDGFVVFHDATESNSGPDRVINELLVSGKYKETEAVCLTRVLQRID